MIEMANKLGQPTPAEIGEAVVICRKAIALERRDDLHLNARIFTLLEPPILIPLKANPDTEDALYAATQDDPQNAFLTYLQAALIFAETQ